jgi:H/ACA ribonucleoprotein complex subunit 1
MPPGFSTPARSGFGGRGGGGGSGGRGRGGGRGGGGRFQQRDEGPPAEIVEAGQVAHECESELLCRWTLTDKVPYFNAGIYLENKRKIGKVRSSLFFLIDEGVQAMRIG